MKLLIDFFPIALFFAAFKVWDIYVATAVAIVATVLTLGYMRIKTGKTEPMQWVSLAVIVVFGGATIVAHNDTFIKWKPTVLYWLFAGSLLVGWLVFRKNLIQALMGQQMQLPEHAWRTVNWSWIGFFAVMGAVNLWVAYTFSTDAWVNFKLFGGLGLMAVFIVGQALYLGRYMSDDGDGAAKS